MSGSALMTSRESATAPRAAAARSPAGAASAEAALAGALERTRDMLEHLCVARCRAPTRAGGALGAVALASTLPRELTEAYARRELWRRDPAMRRAAEAPGWVAFSRRAGSDRRTPRGDSEFEAHLRALDRCVAGTACAVRVDPSASGLFLIVTAAFARPRRRPSELRAWLRRGAFEREAAGVAGALDAEGASALSVSGFGSAEALTRRQIDVLQRFADGEMAKTVADALGISERMVERHMQRAREALGDCRTTAQAVARAVALGVVRPRPGPSGRRAARRG